MPFRKIGPDDYISPSGRHFTKKQVQAYYATNGTFGKKKVKKSLIPPEVRRELKRQLQDAKARWEAAAYERGKQEVLAGLKAVAHLNGSAVDLLLKGGFDESKINREQSAHDGKKPGEFAPKNQAGVGTKGGKEKEAPDDEPEEWDGTINQAEVDGDSDDTKIGEWDFYDDDGEQFHQDVYLRHGTYDPGGALDVVDVWRWESQEDGVAMDVGEWTADEDEAREAGEQYASDNHQEPPEPEDSDIDDVSGQAWGNREQIATYQSENSETRSVRIEEGEFEFGGQTHTCYRWTTRRDDDGEWTLDERQAIRDGEAYAEEQDSGTGDEQEAKEAYRDLVGDTDPLVLCGALAGSTASLLIDSNGDVEVTIRHHKIQDCIRTIARAADGRVYIHNDLFIVKDAYREEGLGAKMFSAQVKAAAEAGVAWIECHAAGPPANPHMNGYYTWPRFGYNQSIDKFRPETQAKIRERFPEAKSVLDIMATAEGREWWGGKKNPDGTRTPGNGVGMLHATFDLTPGSRSLQVQKEYQESLQANSSLRKSTSRPSKKRLLMSPKRSATGNAVHKAFDESKHKRDHGKFSSTGGVSGKSGDAPISAKAPAEHPADTHAKNLLARLAEVPRALRHRVSEYVATKYASMVERYGETGAKAVLGATVLLLPVPVPGTSLLPVAIAEAVLKIRNAVKGKGGPEMKALPGNLDVDAAAKEFLAELTAQFPETDDQNTTDPNATIAAAMVQHALDAAQSGEDAAPGLESLRALIDDPDAFQAATGGGAIHKAWDQSKHPRDKAGRFISKDELTAAQSDPEKAKELRDRVKPEDAAKLEEVLSGRENPGRTKAGQAKHEAGERRDKKTASKQKAKEVLNRIRLNKEVSPQDLHDLADHLPALTLPELRLQRQAFGAKWQGAKVKADMVARLVEHAKQAAAPPEPVDTRSLSQRLDEDLTPADQRNLELSNRLEGASEPDRAPNPDFADREAFDRAEAHRERMGQWAADRPESVAAEEAANRARGRVEALKPPVPAPDGTGRNRTLPDTKPDGTGQSAAPAPNAVKQKEPHEMTVGEFVKDRAGIGADGETVNAFKQLHRTIVEGAIAAGKKIPPEVMNQYQQLQSLARLSELRGSYKAPPRPHEMTREGYLSSHPDAVSQGSKWAEREHRQSVSDALAAGKPVPPEVLKDYPDLAPKPATPAPTAEHTALAAKMRAPHHIVGSSDYTFTVPDGRTLNVPRAEWDALLDTMKKTGDEKAGRAYLAQKIAQLPPKQKPQPDIPDPEVEKRKRIRRLEDFIERNRDSNREGILDDLQQYRAELKELLNESHPAARTS